MNIDKNLIRNWANLCESREDYEDDLESAKRFSIKNTLENFGQLSDLIEDLFGTDIDDTKKIVKLLMNSFLMGTVRSSNLEDTVIGGEKDEKMKKILKLVKFIKRDGAELWSKDLDFPDDVYESEKKEETC